MAVRFVRMQIGRDDRFALVYLANDANEAAYREGTWRSFGGEILYDILTECPPKPVTEAAIFCFSASFRSPTPAGSF